jgi:hypothetical protein
MAANVNAGPHHTREMLVDEKGSRQQTPTQRAVAQDRDIVAAAVDAALEQIVGACSTCSGATRRNRSIYRTEKLLTPMAPILPWANRDCIVSAVSSIGVSESGQCVLRALQEL